MQFSFPLDRKTVEPILNSRIPNFDVASIRQVVLLVDELQNKTGTRFLRMEFGSPGLLPPPLALETEVKATRSPEIISNYTPINGLPVLKVAAERFLKTFLNV